MRKTFILIFITLIVGGAYAIEPREITTSSRKIDPVRVGDTLPDLQLTDTDNHSVKVWNYLETQPLILIYYRGGW